MDRKRRWGRYEVASALVTVALIGFLVARSAHAAVVPRRDILLVGDSILVGSALLKNRDSLPMRLERMRRGWFIANVSRSGMGVAQGAWPRFDPKFMSMMTGVGRTNIIVFLGVNDFYSSVSLDDFMSAYQTIAQTAKNQSEQLVCVTPIWCGNADEPNRIGLVLEDYRAAIRTVCGAYEFPVIEGDPLVPHDAVFYLTDEVPLHPNAAGYRYFARNLAAQLDPLLR